jgi:hypothetical protein
MHFGKPRLSEETVLQACAGRRSGRRHHARSVLAMMSFLCAMAMTILAAIGMDTALAGSANASTITVNSLAGSGCPRHLHPARRD